MRLVRRIVLTTMLIIAFLRVSLVQFTTFYVPPLPENHGKVDAQLFVGDRNNQPLIVAFGGSQSGNTWTEPYWAAMREKFLTQGYAVLAIGYFNTATTPPKLDRISLNAIYDTIIQVSKHPKINREKIALLGTSKGGELVLNLASRYPAINASVALFPGENYTVSGADKTVNYKAIFSGNLRVVSNIVLQAEMMEQAVELAKSCPVLAYGGAVEIRKIPKPIVLNQ